jgi:hypothetical protein
MPLEATIAGEGFRLVLRVLGYEHPGFESGSDANWRPGEAESMSEPRFASAACELTSLIFKILFAPSTLLCASFP